jgi:hypothetical protein
MPEAENRLLPGATNDTWRAWLMTGVRRGPSDRRRMRGAHKGLKRMLLEGMSDGEDRPHAWKDFSGAMIRHAVDEAMRSLPAQDKHVVKLAYFGGYSNRQIAEEVGLTEATVQRRLRRALSSISEHVQHGRVLGRRAAYAVAIWLSGRWLAESGHHAFVQAAAVASVTVIIAAQPAGQPVVQPAPAQHAPSPAATAPSVPPDVPSTQQAPVRLPVNVPALPALPIKIKAPQL